MEAIGDAVLALIPVAIIAYAVVTRDKTVGALVQMGGLQGRQYANDSLASQARLTAAKPVSAATDIPVNKIPAGLQHRKTFTASVINVALTGYILGAFPAKFYLMYTPKAFVLTAIRYIDFIKYKKQWLLMDFCYWANGLVLYYVWCQPENGTLFQVVFMVANGPLAWSMLAFNHSLIFHSYPHITSVFIHASPMLLTFGIRWHATAADGFSVCGGPGADVGDRAEAGSAASGGGRVCDVSSWTLLWQALTTFYLPWIVIYYIAVYAMLGKYLKQRGFQTLYNRVTTKGPLKPVLGALSERGVHPMLKRAVYLLAHLLFGCVSMLMAAVYWRSMWGHLAFIATILSSTAWNGATHYFDAIPDLYKSALIDVARRNADVVQTPPPSPQPSRRAAKSR